MKGSASAKAQRVNSNFLDRWLNPALLTDILNMEEEGSRETLEAAIERGHFARAVFLAESLGLDAQAIKDLREKGLWQISALCRNASGTRILAERFGFSRDELKNLLTRCAAEKGKRGDDKSLSPCYDHRTGKYLTFDEWLDQLIKNWDKLSRS